MTTSRHYIFISHLLPECLEFRLTNNDNNNAQSFLIFFMTTFCCLAVLIFDNWYFDKHVIGGKEYVTKFGKDLAAEQYSHSYNILFHSFKDNG